MTSLKKPTILPPVNADGTALTIAKPGEFSLDKFRATHPPTIAGVATLQRVLPHFKIARAKDFVRLHPTKRTIGRRSIASSVCRLRAKARRYT